ncbi:hypothetical protein [Variovorax boronicumulans]|uniref:hypothetical protein n=1 Tax=Variovorax boronicumulans TaxID=436515 RepID=UPI0033937A12
MSDDRFAPPGAEVLLPVVAPEVPAAILKKIRNAWILGLASATLTLIFVGVALAGTSVLGIGLYQLIDVVFIAAMAFGIYKKSRVCAVLMFLYFLYSRFWMYRMGIFNAGTAVSTLVFAYYYGQGVIGTFAYRKHLRQQVP